MYRPSRLMIMLALIAGISGATLLAIKSKPGFAGRKWAYIHRGTSASVPLPVLMPDVATKLAKMRAAGLHGDRSQIADMIAELNENHPSRIITALHALTQLEATEALPAIEKLLNNPDQACPEEKWVFCTRARLLAAAEAKQHQDVSEQTQVRVERFLNEVGVDAGAINAGATAFKNDKSDHKEWPLELYALHALADMAYRGDYAAFSKVPGMNTLDFSQEEGAALKMRYAQVPKEQRLSAMIDELANKRVLRGEDDYLIQLVADEGAAASQAIAAKLKEMGAHWKNYHHIGFSALFDVLRGIGDPEQASVIEPFRKHPDGWISYYANQAYPFVKAGELCQFSVGY